MQSKQLKFCPKCGLHVEKIQDMIQARRLCGALWEEIDKRQFWTCTDCKKVNLGNYTTYPYCCHCGQKRTPGNAPKIELLSTVK